MTPRILVLIPFLWLLSGPSLAEPASPAVAGPAAIDARSRAELVETMASLAEQRYVDEQAGKALADRLRRQLAAGAFDRLTDPAALAETLTREMRSVVPDNHLRAVHEPDRAARAPMQRIAGSTGPTPYARIDRRSTEQIAATNFGFSAVERMEGNVGYLKLSRLVPLGLSESTAMAALRDLEGSDAVILDLRGVPGGSPDLVVRLLSHFNRSGPIRLMATHNRALGQAEELWTERRFEGGPLAGVPLFVLQDGKSASAAEMLSYFVQRHKLGTVIGETRAGAGNGGNMIPVGSDISFFLPQMRITDGPGWEGIGIKPDIPVSAGEALAVAHREAMKAVQARRTAGRR